MNKPNIGIVTHTIASYRAAGNIFIGSPEIAGTLTITASGTGSRIVVGTGTRLIGVRISLGEGSVVEIGARSTLRGLIRADPKSCVKIGARTSFNRPCQLAATEGAVLQIGDDCLFSDVTVRTSDLHSVIDYKTDKRTNPARGVVIESKVWLSERALVMSGVRIGTGSIVGAGAIVTKSVPPYSVAAGVPARILRQNASWERERRPMAALAAENLPYDVYPCEPRSLRQLTLDNRLNDILAIVANAEQDGKVLEEMDIGIRWYAARAMVETNQSLARATTLLRSVIEERPDHKNAKLYLDKLDEKR